MPCRGLVTLGKARHYQTCFGIIPVKLAKSSRRATKAPGRPPECAKTCTVDNSSLDHSQLPAIGSFQRLGFLGPIEQVLPGLMPPQNDSRKRRSKKT